VLLEEERIAQDKEHSETCAEEVECLRRPRLIAGGTERSTRTKEDSLLSPLWLPPLPLLW